MGQREAVPDLSQCPSLSSDVVEELEGQVKTLDRRVRSCATSEELQ